MRGPTPVIEDIYKRTAAAMSQVASASRTGTVDYRTAAEELIQSLNIHKAIEELESDE